MPRTLLADLAGPSAWCSRSRSGAARLSGPGSTSEVSAQQREGPPRDREGPSTKLLRSAGLAVLGVVVATSAVLLQLKTIRVVTPVLLRNVVPRLADGARQRDLRADVACLGHCWLFLIRSAPGALSSCQPVGG